MVLCDFESPEVAARFRVAGARAEWARDTEASAIAEGVAFAREGVECGALRLVLLPESPSAAVEYGAADGMPSDWSSDGTLSMGVENGSEFMIRLRLTLVDQTGACFSADNLWLLRSKNRLELPLCELVTAEGVALDLRRMQSMKLEILSRERFERDIWLFQFRLGARMPPVVERSGRRLLLDFGPLGAPVVPGAALVHDKTAYAPWRGRGWITDTGGFQPMYFRQPDLLVSDWLWAELGTGTAILRVDLPDGDYRARFYGGNYNSKVVANRSFALSANGRIVAQRAVDAATYYSRSGHFMGMEHWYECGEDPYARYVRPFYQTYDFDFQARGGYVELAWTGTLAAHGLLIVPREGDEFFRSCRAVEEARRESLNANLRMPRVRAPRASDAEKRRGFVVWSRPWSRAAGVHDLPAPRERDSAALRLVAARGERQHVTLTATPLRPLGRLKLQVTALKGPRGATLPRSAVEVRVARPMWLGWPAEVGIGCLFPGREAPSRSKANATFWLTVTPGPRTAPGIYRGKVELTASEGGRVAVPISIEVRPFGLEREHDVTYALWRCSAYNMSYCLRPFLPARIGYLRELLDAELSDMAAHGINTLYLSPPIIRAVSGEHVELDFTLLDEECAAARRHGYCSARHPGMVFLLPDVARYLMKETRYGDFMEPEDLSPGLPAEEQLEEFSSLFVARYLDVARQLTRYFEHGGLHALFYPVDEPRERNINRWNRNRADTIRYCDLLRESIPGVRVYVNPMRDQDAGTDYVPICDHVDVIGTHPWDESGRIVEKCRREGRPELWYFNMIAWDRYDFGLQQAASGARGCWQWHYQWDLMPFQPFHPGPKWGVTIPGPKGPLSRPAYELVAQGIDDYRYYATLRSRTERAREAGISGAAVARAEAAVASFLESAPPYASRARGGPGAEPGYPKRERVGGRTLDGWRELFARHIEAIDRALGDSG